MWAELHTRAARGVPEDYIAEISWLAGFCDRIPCGACRAHFIKLITPVAHSGFERYFEQTVEIHNVINAERAVRIMPLEEARALWS